MGFAGTKKTVRIKRVSVMRNLVGIGKEASLFYLMIW